MQVSERSERALMKTRILALHPAKWLQTATPTTKLFVLARLVRWCFIKNAFLGAVKSSANSSPNFANAGTPNVRHWQQ